MEDNCPWRVHNACSDHQGTPNRANDAGRTITMAIQADKQEMTAVAFTEIRFLYEIYMVIHFFTICVCHIFKYQGHHFLILIFEFKSVKVSSVLL